MQTTRLTFLVAVVLLTATCSVSAQVELVMPWANAMDESKRRTVRQQYLNELIDAIDTACGLTDAQLRRLRVASKGAVEYSFEDEPVQAQNQREPARVDRAILDAGAAAKHSIWIKTLERMLTDEQLKKVKSLEKQQLVRWNQRFAQQPILWVRNNELLLRRAAIRWQAVKDLQRALKVEPPRQPNKPILWKFHPRPAAPKDPRLKAPAAPADRPPWNHLSASAYRGTKRR